MPDPDPEPPEPPNIPPKLRFHLSEIVGVCLLTTLPLAALFGLFGPASRVTRTQAGAVEMVVAAPSRLRHEMSDRIDIKLVNRGSEPVTNVWVSLDPTYIRAFSSVSFTPDPDRPYVVEVPVLRSGEERLIGVEVRAEEHGVHRAIIAVGAGGHVAKVPVKTLILP